MSPENFTANYMWSVSGTFLSILRHWNTGSQKKRIQGNFIHQSYRHWTMALDNQLNWLHIACARVLWNNTLQFLVIIYQFRLSGHVLYKGQKKNWWKRYGVSTKRASTTTWLQHSFCPLALRKWFWMQDGWTFKMFNAFYLYCFLPYSFWLARLVEILISLLP